MQTVSDTISMGKMIKLEQVVVVVSTFLLVGCGTTKADGHKTALGKSRVEIPFSVVPFVRTSESSKYPFTELTRSFGVAAGGISVNFSVWNFELQCTTIVPGAIEPPHQKRQAFSFQFPWILRPPGLTTKQVYGIQELGAATGPRSYTVLVVRPPVRVVKVRWLAGDRTLDQAVPSKGWTVLVAPTSALPDGGDNSSLDPVRYPIGYIDEFDSRGVRIDTFGVVNKPLPMVGAAACLGRVNSSRGQR
jgi:hypothetical protein